MKLAASTLAERRAQDPAHAPSFTVPRTWPCTRTERHTQRPSPPRRCFATQKFGNVPLAIHAAPSSIRSSTCPSTCICSSYGGSAPRQSTCSCWRSNMSSSFPSLDRTPGAFPLPSISEDTLDYALHVPSSASSDPYALTTLITQHVEGLLVQPWLWNKDGWELKLARSSGAAQLASGSGSQRGGLTLEGNNGSREVVMEGRMRVGDAVDDEWLVVWLLREVSKRWSELVIR